MVRTRLARRRWRAAEREGTAGFTLIELMIVMTLIVLLASVVLVNYQNTVQRAREATLKEDLYLMRKAIDEYYADKNKYPADLETLASDKYIREVPVDPFTNSKDTWQTTQSEPDPGNPSAESGISDVKSGSDRTGLDGTPVSEWE